MLKGGCEHPPYAVRWPPTSAFAPSSPAPSNGAAIGNIMMQTIAAGAVANVTEAREVIRRSFDLVEYEPHAADRSP
jgi:rhamnulokinase